MISKQAFKTKKNGEPYWNCICTKPELIENYEEAKNDETQVWECHHRNEKFYTSNELINMRLYYDCPPCELIFLTKEQHNKEYHIGHRQSDETKKKNIYGK